MRLGSIAPRAGATKQRRRRGKGSASGLGGTCGKGHKGHKARTGGGIPTWFEGGQMPLQRRLPKRGFVNRSRVAYQVVNLSRLEGVAANTVIDRAWLVERRLVRGPAPVKILGGGKIESAITVHVDAASASAKQAIESAGGKVQIVAEGTKK